MDSQEITLQQVSQYFDIPLAEAATLLNVSSSKMKIVCRQLGITRWPYRKVNLFIKNFYDAATKIKKTN